MVNEEYNLRLPPPNTYEHDAALTVTQFVLSPNIPPRERKFFEKYQLMFSQTMALGNIQREDIFPMLIAFDEICMLLEIGLFDDARQIMGREIMKMQLSRSIEGFQTIWSSGGITKSEHIERVLARQQKRTLGGRIKGALRRKKSEQWVEE